MTLLVYSVCFTACAMCALIYCSCA